MGGRYVIFGVLYTYVGRWIVKYLKLRKMELCFQNVSKCYIIYQTKASKGVQKTKYYNDYFTNTTAFLSAFPHGNTRHHVYRYVGLRRYI